MSALPLIADIDRRLLDVRFTGGARPNTKENGQISPSTPVRAARVDGSRQNLASVLQEDPKNANIHASSGVIWGNPGYKLSLGDP